MTRSTKSRNRYLPLRPAYSRSVLFLSPARDLLQGPEQIIIRGPPPLFYARHHLPKLPVRELLRLPYQPVHVPPLLAPATIQREPNCGGALRRSLHRRGCGVLPRRLRFLGLVRGVVARGGGLAAAFLARGEAALERAVAVVEAEDGEREERLEDVVAGGVVAEHDLALALVGEALGGGAEVLGARGGDEVAVVFEDGEEGEVVGAGFDGGREVREEARVGAVRVEEDLFAGGDLVRGGGFAVVEETLDDKGGALGVDGAEDDGAHLLVDAEDVEEGEGDVGDEDALARGAAELGEHDAGAHPDEVRDDDLRLALGGDVCDVVATAAEGLVERVAGGCGGEHRDLLHGVGEGGDEQEVRGEDLREDLHAVAHGVEQG
mmetsp:Transcript_28901/g.72576  ORF Transcript_28901/g.72576 Transcript_28901/m.72576 type:complete len:377 (+) Transcript_28901:302-1432(+)